MQRCRRYRAVHEKMHLGIRDTVCDVGSGTGEFEMFLRDQGWLGAYTPVDGSIDGTDLDAWVPHTNFDWIVSIEVLEHLVDPFRMMRLMDYHSVRGCVATTPNTDVVDTEGMDPTHISPLYRVDFIMKNWQWDTRSLFGNPEYRCDNDSILAWKVKR